PGPCATRPGPPSPSSRPGWRRPRPSRRAWSAWSSAAGPRPRSPRHRPRPPAVAAGVAGGRPHSLRGLSPYPAAGGGGGSASGSSCILERPYSYVDSWGAARSGGRSHQGTDVMAPHGARVFAIVNGVVSRESSSANGGIQLYLQGDNGVEYFYAHLSGYAVSTGTRVRAGQLI